jgi:hypothetical protein
MEKIKHVTFEDANKEFEAKFGCADCKINSSSNRREDRSSGIIGIISGILLILAIGFFITLKFFK